MNVPFLRRLLFTGTVVAILSSVAALIGPAALAQDVPAPRSADAEVQPPVGPTPTSPVRAGPEQGRRIPLGPEIVRGPTDRQAIALTFDAGAGATYTPPILEALRSRGVRVTWFVTGQWVDRNVDLFQQILADGHEIANHTYWHPDLTRLSRDQVMAEIESAEDAVLRAGGTSTRPLFRFPFGSRNAAVSSLIQEMGFRSIFWTLDSGDWRPELLPSTIMSRVIRGVEPGSIVVMHADSPQEAIVLGSILDQLSAAGYTVTTVTDLMLGGEAESAGAAG